jgi:hypothetical protein
MMMMMMMMMTTTTTTTTAAVTPPPPPLGSRTECSTPKQKVSGSSSCRFARGW